MPEQIDIAEGRRLLDAATPGPFVVSDDNGVFAHMQSLYRIEKDGWKERVASNMRTTDAKLIVWARNNLPTLLDELEKTQRGARTLGEIIHRTGMEMLDATGAHHLIDDDGDGDWQVVSELLAELRPARDAAIARAEKAEAALAEARATNARLNRRCQQAEKAARDNIDACKRAGMSFGRSLANYAALLYREDLERAQATIARVQKLIDDAEQSPSRGVQFGGTPFPASVGTDELRAALDGDQ